MHAINANVAAFFHTAYQSSHVILLQTIVTQMLHLHVYRLFTEVIPKSKIPTKNEMLRKYATN